MAKKKIVTTTEEVVEELPEEYKEIHNKDLKEIVAEANEPEKEEPKVEESPKEEPKEEKVEEPKFDIEENNRKIAEEAAQKAKEEIANSLLGKDKEQQEEQTSYLEKRRADFEKEKGRQPNWEEVAGFVKDQIRDELQADEKARQEKQAEETKAYESKVQESNRYIETQLNDLRNSNRLPKIADKENAQDLGVLAQHELLTQYTKEVTNIASFNQGKAPEEMAPVPTLKEFFFEKFKGVHPQPAGHDAPVGGSDTGGVLPQAEDEIDYNEMHRTPIRTWVSKLMGR